VIYRALAVVALMGLAAGCGREAAAPVAPPAAVSALVNLDEAEYQRIVAAGKGKVRLVNFWATWCEPCRAEMPALAQIEERLRAKGFELVTVSADEPEDTATAVEFLKTAGVKGTAYLKRVKNDNQFISALEPKWSGALPAMFLFDRAGQRVQFLQGEADLKKLEDDITKLL